MKKMPVVYLSEVDLKYRDKLHELLNDYLLAPVKLTVSTDMLSKYFLKIADRHEIKVGDAKKLIPNLGDKTNYVVHYKNIQLYLSLGMKLIKSFKI